MCFIVVPAALENFTFLCCPIVKCVGFFPSRLLGSVMVLVIGCRIVQRVDTKEQENM